jgi:hypothetical protein
MAQGPSGNGIDACSCGSIKSSQSFWVSGGISPSILNLGTGWRWVVSLKTWLHYSPPPPIERAPVTCLAGGWVGPTVGVNAVNKRKISCTCRKSDPDSIAESLYHLSYAVFMRTKLYNISVLNTLSLF